MHQYDECLQVISKLNGKNLLEKELLRVSPQAQIIEIDFGKPYEYQSDNIHLKVKYSIPDYAIITEQEIIFIPFCCIKPI